MGDFGRVNVRGRLVAVGCSFSVGDSAQARSVTGYELAIHSPRKRDPMGRLIPVSRREFLRKLHVLGHVLGIVEVSQAGQGNPEEGVWYRLTMGVKASGPPASASATSSRSSGIAGHYPMQTSSMHRPNGRLGRAKGSVDP